MAKYVVAPYIIQTKAKGLRGAKAKGLDDINGQGLSLIEALGKILAPMYKRTESYKDPRDPGKEFGLTSLKIVEGLAYLVVIEPGRKGLESEIRKSGALPYKRGTKDAEFIPLRHLIYFPPNSHTAIVFAERFGNYGVITFLRTCFYQVFMDKLPDVTMDFDPMTTLSALRNATYKKLNFKAPRPRDSNGAYLDYAPTVGIEVSLRHQRRIKDLQTEDGTIDSAKVFGVLQDETKATGLNAPSDSSGWSSSMTVEMLNGQERTFAIDDDGPALVYPINGAKISDRLVPHVIRPEDDDFIAICQQILADIQGQFEITSSNRLPTRSSFVDWEPDIQDPWEVRYYDGVKPDGNL